MSTNSLTPQRVLKIVAITLLLFFYSSFLIYKITLPAAQDLPRQMKNGEMVLQGQFDVLTKNVYSSTEPQQDFANHHWLYGVIVFSMHWAIGWSGMVIFKVVFLLSTFALLFYTAIKKANFWLVLLCAIPAIFIISSRGVLRPEMFSYFFLVVFLYALIDLEKNPRSNRIFWLIPLQVAWVNIHLFFPIGLLLVGGFLFEKIILHLQSFWQDVLVRKLSLLLVGLVAAIFLNPYGLVGAIYSLTVNSDKDFPLGSAEVVTLSSVIKQEPLWDNFPAAIFQPLAIILLGSFVVAVAFRLKYKKDVFANNIIFYFLASVGSAVLGFFVIRALPFMGYIFLPAIAANLAEPFAVGVQWLKSRGVKLNKTTALTVGFLLIIVFGGLIYFSQKRLIRQSDRGVGLASWSESSAQFFKEQGLTGPIFNDTDIGSYLIYYLYPQEKVFADNRFGDAYSASFFRDIYLPLIRDEEKWYSAVDAYGFNVIYFYHYDAVEGARNFLFNRFYDPEWALVYVDRYTVIFVKNNEANADIVQKFHITPDNVLDRLRHLTESDEVIDQLAAADFLNLIGRVDLSMSLYMRVVSQWPHNGKVWLVLGRTELTKANQDESNPELAAVFLERAIQEGWKTWDAYSFLALAYFRTGQIERTEWAVKKELRLDPDNVDAQAWMGTLADEKLKNADGIK